MDNQSKLAAKLSTVLPYLNERNRDCRWQQKRVVWDTQECLKFPVQVGFRVQPSTEAYETA